jgi:hypothetical protein
MGFQYDSLFLASYSDTSSFDFVLASKKARVDFIEFLFVFFGGELD